ncbi:hypothetical protein C8Q77DRAFT_1074747 [Trametes polyzona]|nr:hypothetical protein C8Q77DRAFT_1074747 [Trametes polyzona]
MRGCTGAYWVPFKQHTITADYKGEQHEYTLYCCNVEDYLTDIVCNPYLAAHINWDAYRFWRYFKPTQQWVEFFDEPLSARAVWRIQSTLPDGQKPLCLSVYADKTKLSTFGTTKGYPVIMRCTNLPRYIRNGEGPGLDEEAGEKNKIGFVNLKRVVWHKSFCKIFEPIYLHLHTGMWMACGDQVNRWTCPCVIILSADYEEQCTGTNVAEIMAQALNTRTKREWEEILKKYSLRPVENAFLELAHTDPYEALSFDRLYAFDSGLWGHHYWKEFQVQVDRLGDGKIKTLLNKHIPRWSSLHHFKEVMEVHFSDGSKHADICKTSQNVIFFSHNMCTPDAKTSLPYELLRLFRAYQEEYMYTDFEVHTAWTMENGRTTQATHGEWLKAYESLAEEWQGDAKKSWNFPKAHTHMHVFDNIEAKGVTANYNTKPNEKMHGPIKRTYQLRTNYRNVASQILAVDHDFYVAGHIYDELDRLDEAHSEAAQAASEARTTECEDISNGHFLLGAKQPRCTMESLEKAHQNEPAFKNFASQLGRFLTSAYKMHKIPLPDGKSIKFSRDSYVTEYRLIRINYESMVMWRQLADILRCNPMFFGEPRYDCVMIKADPYNYFGRLLLMFTCQVDGQPQLLALIQSYTRPIGPPTQKDINLGFYRLHETPRTECISLHSLHHGVLLIPDFAEKGDFLVHDLVDTDIFLRMKEWKQTLEAH